MKTLIILIALAAVGLGFLVGCIDTHPFGSSDSPAGESITGGHG